MYENMQRHPQCHASVSPGGAPPPVIILTPYYTQPQIEVRGSIVKAAGSLTEGCPNTLEKCIPPRRSICKTTRWGQFIEFCFAFVLFPPKNTVWIAHTLAVSTFSACNRRTTSSCHGCVAPARTGTFHSAARNL